MNLSQVTAVAAAVGDVIAKGTVPRGEGVDDGRRALVWDEGDKERMFATVLRHAYGEGLDIDQVLANIKAKYSEQ